MDSMGAVWLHCSIVFAVTERMVLPVAAILLLLLLLL